MTTPTEEPGQTTHLIARALAHELANALAGIMGVAQLLERRLEPGTPARAKAGQIYAAVTRVSSYPARLSALATGGDRSAESIDLTQLIQDWSTAFTQSAGATIEVSIPPGLPPRWARVHSDRLVSALLLLSLLGRRALPNGGSVQLATGSAASGHVVLSLTARGEGFFTPLPREGSDEEKQDLVSAALRNIAADEGGRLEATDGGSQVVIELLLPASNGPDPAKGP